jgi:hypothetical protein
MAKDFVIYTNEAGVKLLEDAVTDQLRDLINNEEKVFNDKAKSPLHLSSGFINKRPSKRRR